MVHGTCRSPEIVYEKIPDTLDVMCINGNVVYSHTSCYTLTDDMRPGDRGLSDTPSSCTRLERMPRQLFTAIDRYLDYTVCPLLEKTVCLSDTAQREAMGNERCCVDSTLLEKTENLGTVAAIHPSRLEGQVFPYISGKGSNCGLS